MARPEVTALRFCDIVAESRTFLELCVDGVCAEEPLRRSLSLPCLGSSAWTSSEDCDSWLLSSSEFEISSDGSSHGVTEQRNKDVRLTWSEDSTDDGEISTADGTIADSESLFGDMDSSQLPGSHGPPGIHGFLASTQPFLVDDTQPLKGCKREALVSVTVNGLPKTFARSDFLTLLGTHGFLEICDFVYVPHDFKSERCCGSASVNFVSSDVAQRFLQIFNGLQLRLFGALSASWSSSQGLIDHIEKYRNSPIMHPSVPKEMQPLLLRNGTFMSFPPPAKALKVPKLMRRAVQRGSYREV